MTRSLVTEINDASAVPMETAGYRSEEDVPVGGGDGNPSLAPEVIRETTIRILSERIRLLGVERSGAYTHYHALLSRGFPTPVFEVAILDLVRQRLPDLRSYHEIGSGLGMLPLMLAYDGFAAVGVERDERRHLTALAILRDLASRFPHVEANCRLFGAEFPDAVADLDVSDSLAILTDFVSTRTPEEYVQLCHGLTRYRYVLLDMQRFCIKRDRSDERQKLLEELATYGLIQRPEIIDLDTEGYYCLFETTTGPQNMVPSEVVRLPGENSDTSPRPFPSPIPQSERSLPSPIPQNERSLAPAKPEQPNHAIQLVLPPMPQRKRPRRFSIGLFLSALLVIGVPSLIATAYYGFLASNQYVTNFEFAVRGRADTPNGRTGTVSMGSFGGGGMMSPDAFVVTDYINSSQAVGDIQKQLDLYTIYSAPGIDVWAKLPPNSSAEELNAYWGRMVNAHFDIISGDISVVVRAFTPHASLNLAKALINTSNDMFRRLNTQSQRDFVRLADENLDRSEQRLREAQQALIAFRDKSGILDPGKTAQAGSQIVDDLRKELAELQTHYASMQAITPNSPQLPVTKRQIEALESHIATQDRLVSSPIKVVTAAVLGKYDSLHLNRDLAEKEYTEALALRNQAYLMAQNQQSYLALFIAPTLAQTSTYPDRPKSIATVILAAAAAWFIGTLLMYAIRDHLM